MVETQQGPAGLRRFRRPLVVILVVVLVVGPFGVLLSRGFLYWLAHRAGIVTEYPLPSSGSNLPNDPAEITSGPDGALWFTEPNAYQIGRITTGGVVTEYPAVSRDTYLVGMTSGPDGALWFTAESATIGRITTGGVVTLYPLSSRSDPGDITTGPDKALWFTETGVTGTIGRITADGGHG